MDLDEFICNTWERRPINKDDLNRLFSAAKDVLIYEDSLLRLNPAIVVCGNINGQFYDLRRIFEENGKPPETQYLFLGDYVDYGYYSIETISLLLAYKCQYPDRIYLLRGHHETHRETRVKGFYSEIVRYFGDGEMWRKFMEVIEYLPLAATVGKRMFCVHGGIGPSVESVESINKIDYAARRMEIPMHGMMTELLMSSPKDDIDGFVPREDLGVYFGADVTATFCHENKLDMICRSHDLAMEGYRMQFDGLVATVWSAPNYKYKVRNTAAVLKVNPWFQRKFKLFQAVPDEDRVIPKNRT